MQHWYSVAVKYFSVFIFTLNAPKDLQEKWADKER